jgi:cobalt-zinc-cadmium efflux system membrane fusion protein
MKRLCLVLLIACNKTVAPGPVAAHEGAHAHDDTHEDKDEHEMLPNRVTLSETVAKKAKVRTEKVALRALAATLDLTGEVIADPDARAIVTARMAGRIIDVRFRENERVKAGDVLVVLESAELARSRAALTSAQARAVAARRNFERLGSLTEKGLASGQEVEAAKSELATTEADALSAKQILSAFGQGQAEDAALAYVTAPIAGRVLVRSAVRGENVAADRTLAEIASLERPYFVARVFEKDVELVSANAKAEVRLNAYPSDVFVGTVESIASAVDPIARTVLARIRIDNQRDMLKVGLFGSARIGMSGGSTSARLAVPVGAVVETHGKKIVFVLEADREFAVHEVTLGRSAEGYQEVTAGLREGEQVVVEGAFTLKSLLLKATFGEDE